MPGGFANHLISTNPEDVDPCAPIDANAHGNKKGPV